MGQKRYTVRDAADRLGISESAVRNRLSRGTLESIRVEGATYVVLEDVTSDIPPTDATTDHRDELIEELRDRVRSLEEANRENRRLLLLALQGSETRQICAPENGDRSPDVEEPPESAEGSRVSWRVSLRRLFGG